ncbi:hypothetical protein P3H80_17580 [Mycolicibacterium septicum]|uniref:hypothetical protein n=1 Tax=Mycolicibacterium septicum TaxID=98668 RepID=UPI0023E34495|nr:hypothetical protein [Mycolicibacterium septicum]MDF3339251.1 hypothetical protein [Mycolicibacterium septicum]
MIITKAPPAPTNPLPRIDALRPVGGPVWVAWRESTLTRAFELETLTDFLAQNSSRDIDSALAKAIKCHLSAARDAASGKKPELGMRIRLSRNGPLLERAMSNLDAAEAQLLNLAPNDYLLGQVPSLLRHVQRHLRSSDPGRQEFERLVRNINNDRGSALDKVDAARDQIVATVRAASSAALRENIRLRSFRNIVVSTTLLLSVLVVVLGVIGYLKPTLIPMCFAPQEASQLTMVCPTDESVPFTPVRPGADKTVSPREFGDVLTETVRKTDVIVIELVGLVAAAIAAAAAISHVRGSSERYGIPVALAALKLPTGALTAFLGLLLMRGGFVPGLNALDTSAQILAWGLVFGYAQQLFTRLIDQQGQSVLNAVRGADTVPPPRKTVAA